MSFDPNLLHNNGHNGYPNGTSAALRETGVIEKLLTSYGFIQCSERQARLFFHCSQYNGNLWRLIVSILGALFGAFNATGNCKIHFACVK
uniref:CSD domain-containing protein n=1 Tax=Rhinopithecus bieti TaxID=61621 RepID=A0A2K6LY07_RHIBE